MTSQIGMNLLTQLTLTSNPLIHSHALISLVLYRYLAAKTTIIDRDKRIQQTIESIEQGLQLLAVTGVEDKLQEDVRGTLEMLRNANIKIWMLTGMHLIHH